MIETLPPDRIDEARALRVALHRHHSAIDIPAGFVARDEDAAWQRWRHAAVALLESGRAELFLHRRSAEAVADGLALVTVLPAEALERPVLIGTGVHAELLTLVVSGADRGRGTGAALYDTAAAWARERGATALHIDTRADNDGGLRFYERQGARPAFLQLVAPL